MTYSVTGLYKYPLKSASATLLGEAIIDRFGVQGDRRWMLVGENNRFLTQRQRPQMARLQVSETTQGLLINMNDSTIEVQLADLLSCARPCEVTVWQDTCIAYQANDSINEWFSIALKRICKLVYMPDSTKRLVDPNYADNNVTVSFADGFPLLLTTEASLSELNRHFPEYVDMLRFRPNLVIDSDMPFAEDQWKNIRIGTLNFSVVKPCARCVIPTIDPKTGNKNPEVFKTLQRHRQHNGEVFFGQNIIAYGEGVIRVGDTVEVIT